ncbi:hypothetical protein [Sinorhizobium meliloti]|uniref:hypothetical protein n=1 Tax=Rhizobium meliloti TaxID=382 RepID=UPI0012FE6A7A|nr:hypothetical protein [Sinorhizobium meliloti]
MAGYTPLNARITLGLPHAIALDQRFTLGLVAPSGLARFWLATPREAVVSEAGEDRPSASPFRLLLRTTGGLIGVTPLVLGPARFICVTGATPPGLRLRITGWRIHAGSLVGPGDFGSYVALDWRPWGAAAEHFEAPTARPAVLRRLTLEAPDMSVTLQENLAALVETTAAPGPGAERFRGYGQSFADG